MNKLSRGPPSLVKSLTSKVCLSISETNFFLLQFPFFYRKKLSVAPYNLSTEQSLSRKDKARGHVIIAGTGRAGTTLIVQLFTVLGFDTGYSVENAFEKVDAISEAGLEHPPISDVNPYVIKSPWFSDALMEGLDSKKIKIHAAIIPVRDLFSAAESRRRVAREGGDWGGLWCTDNPSHQEEALAIQFYKTIFPLVRHGVKIYFVEFPRLAHDRKYLYDALQGLLNEHSVDINEFSRAHEFVVRLEKIHRFG